MEGGKVNYMRSFTNSNVPKNVSLENQTQNSIIQKVNQTQPVNENYEINILCKNNYCV